MAKYPPILICIHIYYWENGKENGNYDIIMYTYILLGEWKRKWKLLYYNRVYIYILSVAKSEESCPPSCRAPCSNIYLRAPTAAMNGAALKW